MAFTFLTSFTFRRDGDRLHARTIFGWTPGLRSLIAGRVLECGCLAGTYETWTDEVLALIDARGTACRHVHHRAHALLWKGRRNALALSFDERLADSQVA